MVNDKTHVHLIVELSMCAGDKFEQVKQVTMDDSSKRNEKAVFKRAQEISFYIWNLSIGMSYYQERLGSKVFDLELVLKRT